MSETAQGTEIARVDPLQSMELLRPLPIAYLMETQQMLRKFIREGLTPGVDYGAIPGVQKRAKRDENGNKVLVKGKEVMEEPKSLFKAGAEKCAGLFNLYPRYVILEQEVNHHVTLMWQKRQKKWKNEEGRNVPDGESITTGESIGIYRYVIVCELVSRASGKVMGMHPGICSTLEAKYIDRPRECENTVMKMSCVRGLRGVVLNVLGLSDEFTQDLEDDPDVEIEIMKREERERQVAETKADPQRPKPVASLDDAKAMIYPGKKLPENPYGGKPLGEVPRSKLMELVVWSAQKYALTVDELFSDEADVTHIPIDVRTRMVAVKMVLDDLDAKKKLHQEEIAAGLERAQQAGAAKAAVAPLDIAGGALDTDDDLPF